MFEHTIELSGATTRVVHGRGVAERLGAELDQLGLSGRVAVVLDSGVPIEFAETVLEALRGGGREVSHATLELTEPRKTMETVAQVHSHLAASRLERRECVVAVGGGVAGDLVGFAAATWLRGVALALVPTTLTAMVDASMGGKTGVNTVHGKNLVGAFHPARLVLQDSAVLDRLPEREWLSGLAEALKHGLILDGDLLEFMERNRPTLLERGTAAAQHVITRSIEIKSEVVGADTRELGEQRLLLNYGHTVGHALEAVTEFGTLSHGEAIAIGMTVAARVSRLLGLLTEAEETRQAAVLAAYGLPTTIAADPAAVLEAARMDKKVRDGGLVWIVLAGLGRAVVRRDVPAATAREAVAAVLAAGGADC